MQTLIRKDRKVHPDLLNKIEALIQKKVNQQGRQLAKIFIDFGKYPLLKSWLLKKEDRKQLEEAIEQDESEVWIM